jgi:hypothetical protein
MTSRERLLAAIRGAGADHVPLTTWCFGLPAPARARWTTGGRDVPFWYSMRLEHIHTLPHPWTLADEFRRALAWRDFGVDDWLEVSVPWSMDPEVTFEDTTLAAGAPGGDPRYPVAVRRYRTPAGALKHAVRKTPPEGPGWPLQPEGVPLIEDYNIPRALKAAVAGPADVAPLRCLFMPPSASQREWFGQRMRAMSAFAGREGFPVQAWTAFGMDAVVWFCGAEGAIMLAMDAPGAFRALVELVAATDYARTELAASDPGVDLVVQRGWYSSTDFWSPALFDEYVFPHVRSLAALAHRHGKPFGYVMTTGVETLGPRLAEAGVDLLYFVDPVQDRITRREARERLGDRMALVGGTNALSLASGDPGRIRAEVRESIETLGPTGRFILHPVDAVFPDTPWEGIECMIEAWKEYR